MHVQRYPEAAVPPELRSQVWALQEQAWPSGDPDPGVSRDPALEPESLLLVDGGRVVAALDLLSKQLDHAGRSYRARGLSTVVTDRAYQGRGYGRQLVAAALQEVRRSGADLGLFTCDRPLQRFYESAGWQLLPGTVLIGGTAADPFPSDRPGFDKVTMTFLCTPRAQAARQSFEHARIALHPGVLDRLW
ncbi:GNAT family N-acetyltransferase [Kitasatospora sp. MAP5-34]|uniref:GNAT family N-acetyltransferase n=1 Tax=Kitasatospora sp. MAP5-34 TaxID=3035102 RepID=UPI00247358CD|nr:GNAT family N-acetyltransferase [Kitasatospora sp. MAP5-34]MDH6578958.1 aminoglycoside 2'-N-acetyltransferase I [Kitasatospora sp. MAP5-34]